MTLSPSRTWGWGEGSAGRTVANLEAITAAHSGQAQPGASPGSDTCELRYRQPAAGLAVTPRNPPPPLRARDAAGQGRRGRGSGKTREGLTELAGCHGCGRRGRGLGRAGAAAGTPRAEGRRVGRARARADRGARRAVT